MNAPWEPDSHFLKGYRLTPLFFSMNLLHAFPLVSFCQVIPYLWAHMCTYTHNRRPSSSSLGERTPTLADQNGHVWFQFPKERKLIGHLKPDTQPNLDSAALSRIQFCWQEDGHSYWDNQQILPQTMTHFVFPSREFHLPEVQGRDEGR